MKKDLLTFVIRLLIQWDDDTRDRGRQFPFFPHMGIASGRRVQMLIIFVIGSDLGLVFFVISGVLDCTLLLISTLNHLQVT